MAKEERFEIKPVGVRYICEFCDDGEMKFDPLQQHNENNLYFHKCNKCGKSMLLPKVYPYIDWVPQE